MKTTILTNALLDFELDKFESYSILTCFVLIAIIIFVIVIKELNRKENEDY